MQLCPDGAQTACLRRGRWFGTEPGGTVALELRAHSTGNDADAMTLRLPERFVAPFLTGTLSEKEYVRNLRRIQVNRARPSATAVCLALSAPQLWCTSALCAGLGSARSPCTTATDSCTNGAGDWKY